MLIVLGLAVVVAALALQQSRLLLFDDEIVQLLNVSASASAAAAGTKAGPSAASGPTAAAGGIDQTSSAAAAGVLELEEWMKRNSGSAINDKPAEATAAAVKVNEAIASGVTPTNVFHHSNIVDSKASYAVCFTGMVRTWKHSRSFFERTFVHAANGPLDLFFHVYSPDFDHQGDAANFDKVKEDMAENLLALPRRSLHLEHWDLVSLEALRLALDNTHCRAGRAEENNCTKRELTAKIHIPVISHFRKNLLCYRALQRHIASPARCGKPYDAIVVTRLDIVYPPEPFFLKLVAETDKLLIPAGADMPINDQLAMGRPDAIEGYMTSFEYCRDRLIKEDKRAAVKQTSLEKHYCANGLYEDGLEWSVYGSIVGANPGDDLLHHQRDVLRRFWFQYWILRENQVWYFDKYPRTALRSFYSISCWGKLNFKSRPRGLEHGSLVWMNTTCSCIPEHLSFQMRSGGGYVDLISESELRLVCNHDGNDYCNSKKYPSSCKAGPPPPGPPENEKL